MSPTSDKNIQKGFSKTVIDFVNANVVLNLYCLESKNTAIERK